MIREREGGQDLPAVTVQVPEANWLEYIQWLLGRRRRFVVRENSMVPTLMPGDTVLAEMGVSGQVGEIVILQGTSGLLLVKRVGEIFYDGGIYVISDNTNDPSVRDSRHFGVIDPEQILGCVTSRLAEAPQ